MEAHVFGAQSRPQLNSLLLAHCFLPQDNGGSAAGFGMAVSWVLAILLALVTVVTMLCAGCGRGKVGFSLTTLSNWTMVFSIGVVVATTVRFFLYFSLVMFHSCGMFSVRGFHLRGGVSQPGSGIHVFFLSSHVYTGWNVAVEANVLCVCFFFLLFPRSQVFWWLIEGKFGNRDEALAPRLLAIVDDAASACTSDVGATTPCFNAPWEMETPGWSLSLGITSVSYLRRFFVHVHSPGFSIASPIEGGPNI